mgnify:CR=1 FL=1
MGAMTKEVLHQYKDKLEQGILEYMRMPIGERSSSGVRGMLECWSMIDAAEQSMCSGGGEMTKADAEAWAAHMVNEDGTTGPHWPMEQTTALAESMGLSWDHISPWCWWVTMNMMYSDYGGVAIHYGVSTAEFFAELAQAFLFDKDGPGPKEKLAAYYHGIVKAG